MARASCCCAAEGVLCSGEDPGHRSALGRSGSLFDGLGELLLRRGGECCALGGTRAIEVHWAAAGPGGLFKGAHAFDQHGWTAITSVLLEAKADPNKANDEGVTALIKAAEYGHEQCVRALTEAGSGERGLPSR